MSEENNPYTANGGIKKNNKYFIPGVNAKPIYLSKDDAEPFYSCLLEKLLFCISDSNADWSYDRVVYCPEINSPHLRL
jgi:hypothetical protein